jgi:riboflavin-specific deaminase-like protein
MEFRRLYPDAATVELESLLDSLDLAVRAPAARPYVIVNFVASIDGRATLHGRSGGLGDGGDNRLFHGLRERSDAVMAGTATLQTERYGRIVSKPERREQRLARGRSAEPLACVISRTGMLPIDIPLFAEPEARIVVFSPRGLDVSECRAQVEVVEVQSGESMLAVAFEHLRKRHDVRLLLCEGGPTLFGAMLRAGLVDELFLTIAPKLVGGGSGPAVLSGPELPMPAQVELKWLLERRSSLYARYRVS